MSTRDEEADYWFARMHAPDAGSDQAEFEAWRADPENAEAYAQAEENWLLTAGVAPGYIEAHRKSPFPPARSRAHWAIAAALLLALSLACIWVVVGDRSSETRIAGNETGEVTLEDGSRVLLMDGARIDPQIDATERHIILRGGRARFTVAHDAARPFRVEAAGSETVALGTIFEVDLRKREPVIHLIEGSVEVRAAAKPAVTLRLRSGQRATISNGAPTLVEGSTTASASTEVAAPAADRPASLLIADSMPLGAILDRANRVNAAKIQVADASLGNRLVSGRFDVANAPSLSRKLAVALDLVMEKRGDLIVLTSK